MKKLLFLLVACFQVSLAAQTQLPPAASVKVDYDQHVRPLLSQNCYSCHGPEVQQSGLRLDLRQNALRGGDYGPVINPGNSAESKLIRRLVNGDGGLQMPPTGALSDDEIATLRALGFNTASVLVSVLAESFGLAALGGALGGLIAFLGFNGYQTSTMNWQTFSQVAFAFAVTPWLLAQGLGYALVMGLIGGLLPAVRAARLPIASALREL